jgi:hypothetical protein
MGFDTGVGSQDPALYTFLVDIQRTVQTVADLEDGDRTVELTSVDFIIVGSRVRITGAVESPIVDVIGVDTSTNEIEFEPISLQETIPAGVDAINLFTGEEIEVIDRIVKFAKVSHTHHKFTRDRGEDEVEVG